jgi:hypothetical protein
MSKTLFVEFRGRGFWAFDVVSGVFLKHLIDASTPYLERPDYAWLCDAAGHWRFNAVIGDAGLFLDDSWSSEQTATVTKLATAACSELSKRAEIPAEEIESWLLLDDLRPFARSLPSVTTASAIRLGRAIIELINGTFPESPAGTWWLFSTEDAPTTIRKRAY